MGRNALVGPATKFIAGELRAQRARLGWTLDEAAARSGLNRSTVNRALSGDAAIAIEALLPLSAALGLDAGDLLRAAQSPRRDGVIALQPGPVDALDDGDADDEAIAALDRDDSPEIESWQSEP